MGLPELTPPEVPEISKAYLDALLRRIPTCTVGKKYGALCHDGTYTHDSSEEACHNHKGVKEWVECR